MGIHGVLVFGVLFCFSLWLNIALSNGEERVMNGQVQKGASESEGVGFF